MGGVVCQLLVKNPKIQSGQGSGCHQCDDVIIIIIITDSSSNVKAGQWIHCQWFHQDLYQAHGENLTVIEQNSGTKYKCIFILMQIRRVWVDLVKLYFRVLSLSHLQSPWFRKGTWPFPIKHFLLFCLSGPGVGMDDPWWSNSAFFFLWFTMAKMMNLPQSPHFPSSSRAKWHHLFGSVLTLEGALLRLGLI